MPPANEKQIPWGMTTRNSKSLLLRALPFFSSPRVPLIREILTENRQIGLVLAVQEPRRHLVHRGEAGVTTSGQHFLHRGWLTKA